jgi:hypothetical protein
MRKTNKAWGENKEEQNANLRWIIFLMHVAALSDDVIFHGSPTRAMKGPPRIALAWFPCLRSPPNFAGRLHGS